MTSYFPAVTIALITAALTPFCFSRIRASVDVSNWHLELAIFARIVASSKPALAILRTFVVLESDSTWSSPRRLFRQNPDLSATVSEVAALKPWPWFWCSSR